MANPDFIRATSATVGCCRCTWGCLLMLVPIGTATLTASELWRLASCLLFRFRSNETVKQGATEPARPWSGASAGGYSPQRLQPSHDPLDFIGGHVPSLTLNPAPHARQQRRGTRFWLLFQLPTAVGLQAWRPRDSKCLIRKEKSALSGFACETAPFFSRRRCSPRAARWSR